MLQGSSRINGTHITEKPGIKWVNKSNCRCLIIVLQFLFGLSGWFFCDAFVSPT